jgi:mannose-1-phosphate guanylyltransferase
MVPTLVLTAGLGTRLDPLTRLVAKPAVPLAGPTLVERVLGWLGREGITEVVLNLHFRPETITAIVGDGSALGLHVRYSWEQPIHGTAGDTLCPIAIRPLVAAHRRTGALATLAVIPNPAPDHYNGIVAAPDGTITGFVPKGAAAGSWHFIGVQVVEAQLLAPLPDGVPSETVAGLYRDRLAESPGRFHVWPVRTPFRDVGTPRDYLVAALSLGAAEASVVAPGATVAPSARLIRSVVWPGATIGPDAALHEVIVAGPVRLPRGFAAHEALVLPAAVVRAGETVEVRDGVAVFPLHR